MNPLSDTCPDNEQPIAGDQLDDTQPPDEVDRKPIADATPEEAQASPPPAADGLWDEIRHHLRESKACPQAILQRLDAFQESVDGLAKLVSYLPPQLRMLGGKIDGLTTSLAEPRCRALLLGLLSIQDLVDQMLRAPENGSLPAPDHRRNYEVLATQIGQLLASNGLSEIPTDGEFDPQLHRAVGSAPCDDPARENRVAEVVRRGFRTEQSVLRYAEVLVGQCTSQEGNQAPVEPSRTAVDPAAEAMSEGDEG